VADGFGPTVGQAHGLSRGLKSLLAAVVAVFAFGALGAAAAASPLSQAIAADEREEQAEGAEEQADEAAIAPFALALAELTPGQARRIEAIKLHMENLKAKILHIRESKAVDRLLAHTTTRWLVHLPKKRQHLKELRAKKHELRLKMEEVRAG